MPKTDLLSIEGIASVEKLERESNPERICVTLSLGSYPLYTRAFLYLTPEDAKNIDMASGFDIVIQHRGDK